MSADSLEQRVICFVTRAPVFKLGRKECPLYVRFISAFCWNGNTEAAAPLLAQTHTQ